MRSNRTASDAGEENPSSKGGRRVYSISLSFSERT